VRDPRTKECGRHARGRKRQTLAPVDVTRAPVLPDTDRTDHAEDDQRNDRRIVGRGVRERDESRHDHHRPARTEEPQDQAGSKRGGKYSDHEIIVAQAGSSG